mmetsp:Transcript_3032/g.7033  ORF Transcript_3032/g.7033 Transcript_3032/m.7033 type:complete len:210 (-) Transcript_3032:137-766(-)
MDPFKYSFPAAIPGGGSSLPPATATMMWANGVKNSYEQALAAHQKLSANGNQIASTIAKMSAAVAQAEQAKLAAESSAAASFARDNGFAVAAATSGLGEGIGALAVGVVAGMAEVQGSCPSCREGSERTRTQEEIDENDKLGERKNTDFFRSCNGQSSKVRVVQRRRHDTRSNSGRKVCAEDAGENDSAATCAVGGAYSHKRDWKTLYF